MNSKFSELKGKCIEAAAIKLANESFREAAKKEFAKLRKGIWKGSNLTIDQRIDLAAMEHCMERWILHETHVACKNAMGWSARINAFPEFEKMLLQYKKEGFDATYTWRSSTGQLHHKWVDEMTGVELEEADAFDDALADQDKAAVKRRRRAHIKNPEWTGNITGRQAWKLRQACSRKTA